MVRAPGGVEIGGVEFDRPAPGPGGVFALDDRHVRDSTRAHVALPGGGWLDFWGRGDAQPTPRPSGDQYEDCLSPFASHPDATLTSEFDIRRCAGPAAGVTQSMSLDVLDRKYGWVVDRAIEDAVTGEFLESSAPESVESPDGQSGLDGFLGELKPCPRGKIRSCDCCRCPADDCGIKSIRHRKNKDPTYACNSQNCDAEFDKPALRPARGESEPGGD